MKSDEYRMHIWVCHVYGKQSACRNKVNYRSEQKANEKAQTLTKQYCKLLEAYPCAFCDGWHIGRALTDEERSKFYKEANSKTLPKEEQL